MVMQSSDSSVPVTVRPATAADLEVVLHQRREMFREMGGRYKDLLEEFEPASRTYFKRALLDGSYYGLLAEIDAEIIAGGGIVIVPWPGSPLNFEPKRAWLLNVYVESQYRRRGLARAMIEKLIDWARENGFHSLALHASEEGRRLYDKLGFRATNEMRLAL